MGAGGEGEAAMNDKTLIRIVSSFRSGILGKNGSHRACFMVCAPLAGMLRCYGVDVELIEGMVEEGNHFWLRLADGRALDPTADQFDARLPRVYLGEPIPAIHGHQAR